MRRQSAQPDADTRAPAAASLEPRGAVEVTVSAHQDAVNDPPAGGDDAELVARCRADSPGAWAEMVQRYQRLVYAIALRAGLDEAGAADVFQTVFSRLLQHLGRLAAPHRLRAWIVTTAKREALLQRRLARRTVPLHLPGHDGEDVLLHDPADEAPLAEQALAQLQQLDLLRHALQRLDERSRALVELLFRDDDERLSYDEVARRLGIPVGSIGPTRSRILARLRRFMH